MNSASGDKQDRGSVFPRIREPIPCREPRQCLQGTCSSTTKSVPPEGEGGAFCTLLLGSFLWSKLRFPGKPQRHRESPEPFPSLPWLTPALFFSHLLLKLGHSHGRSTPGKHRLCPHPPVSSLRGPRCSVCVPTSSGHRPLYHPHHAQPVGTQREMRSFDFLFE